MVAGYAVIVDSSGRIRWLNRAPPGVGVEALVNSTLVDGVVEDQRELVRRIADGVLAGGPPASLEVCSSVTGRWYSARIDRIAKRGVVEGLFIHALDIDEAKRNKRALELQRAQISAARIEAPASEIAAQLRRFELMADALPVLISYVDSQRRYQYNNRSYELWFGVSREELRGRSLEEVLGPAAYAGIKGHVDAALAGESVRFESTVPYRDAGLRRVFARYVPDWRPDGEVTGFYALIEDVSAQREAEDALRQREEQLRETQKLEALGRLATGIAHEFGNLLMTVLSGCGAVAETLEPGTSGAAMLAKVERAAERGRSLTQQLLAFGCPDDDGDEIIELDAVVGDVVVLLDRVLGSRIDLEVDLGADVRVKLEAGQLQQILMNLAINARDAMPEGGRLRILTSLVELNAGQVARSGRLEPGTHALLTVSDTGTGMDEATRARIFDPFFTTKEPGQGTGLGLSTVFGIVRQAHGHIEVESAPRLGTAFRIYLPVVTAEP